MLPFSPPRDPAWSLATPTRRLTSLSSVQRTVLPYNGAATAHRKSENRRSSSLDHTHRHQLVSLGRYSIPLYNPGPQSFYIYIDLEVTLQVIMNGAQILAGAQTWPEYRPISTKAHSRSPSLVYEPSCNHNSHPPTNKRVRSPPSTSCLSSCHHLLFTSSHLIDICAPLQILSTASPLFQSRAATPSILGYDASANGKRAPNLHSGTLLMLLSPPRHRLPIDLDVD